MGRSLQGGRIVELILRFRPLGEDPLWDYEEGGDFTGVPRIIPSSNKILWGDRWMPLGYWGALS